MITIYNMLYFLSIVYTIFSIIFVYFENWMLFIFSMILSLAAYFVGKGIENFEKKAHNCIDKDL